MASDSGMAALKYFEQTNVLNGAHAGATETLAGNMSYYGILTEDVNTHHGDSAGMCTMINGLGLADGSLASFNTMGGIDLEESNNVFQLHRVVQES